MMSNISNLEIGAELPSITREMTQERMDYYSGDSLTVKRGTSIHIFKEMALRAGHRDTIAQGLMSAEQISEMLTDSFGEGWVCGGKLKVAFIAPVFPGDVITSCARVTSVKSEGARKRVECEVWCSNQDGDKVTVGTASALIS
jgi:acyl dehydratase